MLSGEKIGQRLTRVESNLWALAITLERKSEWELTLLRKAKEDQNLIKDLYYENIKLEIEHAKQSGNATTADRGTSGGYHPSGRVPIMDGDDSPASK